MDLHPEGLHRDGKMDGKKGVCLLLLYNVSDMHPPNNAMGHQQANIPL